MNIATLCLGQYYEQGAVPQVQSPYEPQERYYREPVHTPPPPQIISHKQAQHHDGNFKYAFAAENGLAQGEYIAPDGSRNGGYTYVDPNGKKISVKYTAGKEGFRIIEGDHIPKAPPQQAAIPHPGYATAVQPAYNYQQQQQQGQYDDGQYKPEKYERPAPQPLGLGAVAFRAPQPIYTQPQPRFPAPIQRSEGNSLDEKQPAYNDEPGKPHSFGSGYSFEFGG